MKRRSRLLRLALMLASVTGLALPAHAEDDPAAKLPRICTLIEENAERNGLPAPFLARLIWKESRFDHLAVSPAGAEGVAQFMPGTAKARGLADSFDIEQAIPASAAYLAELEKGFGNLGLAAAAYNAGEARVSRWLGSGGFLPLETEDYVLDITGLSADSFVGHRGAVEVKPLDEKLSFREACLKLPVMKTRTVAMAQIVRKPWAIQVAGNFRRAAAVRQWERMRRQVGGTVASAHIYVSRVRSPMGRRGIYAVRIGADSRGEADRVCSQLRSRGGACVVLKNR